MISKNVKIWYAVYTKPRCEKKVHTMLSLKGVESYCPLNKVNRRWSDRNKVVEEPLFKSYVFVKLAEAEKNEVQLTEGVVNFVYWLGKPAVIKDAEIITIKKFLRDYEQVYAERIDLMPNQRVKITSGVLMDREGIVLKRYNNKVVIMLDNIGYRLVAELEPNSIDILKN
jgi:transcription antitermination factor NusG